MAVWHIGGMEVVERNHALVVNSFFWTILAFIVTILRLFTRGYVIKRIGPDDWLMTGAMVSHASLESLTISVMLTVALRPHLSAS